MSISPLAKLTSLPAVAAGLALLVVSSVSAQDVAAPSSEQAAPESADGAEEPPVTSEEIRQAAEDVKEETQKQVSRIAEGLDQSEAAKEVSAGILNPIYKLAEHLSFPTIHWVAFALMATGVVNFALQLVLGKLVVLSKLGFSITEILSDTLGLVISLLGLVLTTQAAAENSTFTQSPAAVLSASAAGLVAGYIFYRWGQAHEIQAAAGRSAAQRAEKRSGTGTRLN